jgi:hypothetical protein
VTLTLMLHDGRWLLATPCSPITSCNRFPIESDLPGIRSVTAMWQLAAAGYNHATGAALCAALAPSFRKQVTALGAQLAGHPVRCSDAIIAELATPGPDFHRYPLARIQADMKAEVIHDRGNTATVTMHNADFGGSDNWILQWNKGHWLLATFDG